MSAHVNDQPLGEQLANLRAAVVEHADTHEKSNSDYDERIAAIESRLQAIENERDNRVSASENTTNFKPDSQPTTGNPYQQQSHD